MAYKFQVGDALLGGALRQKGTITGEGVVSASTNLVIGAASISEAELEVIDDVTAGTVAVNKAVVVDGNKDISEFRNLQAVQLSASSNIVIGAADINETDLEKIDGITNGDVAANKALVVNATQDLAGNVGDRIRNLSIDGDFEGQHITASTGVSASLATFATMNVDTINGGAFIGTDFDVSTGGNYTLFDTVGGNTLTLGAASSTVVIAGNLTVEGTRTLIDTDSLRIEDNVIEINRGDGAGGTRASNANAGFFVSGSSTVNDASLTLFTDGGRFRASGSAAGFDIVSGGDYRINNTSVLTADTLGSGVATSSLNEVGTLTAGAIGGGFTQIAVSGVVGISSLDIDGGIAIGSLADADLIVVDDGASGVNKKATMSQLATYIGSAGARASGYNIRSITTAQGTTFQMAGLTGLYGFQSDHTASMNIDLSGSWSSGDLVIIKSNASGAAFPLTIRPSGSQLVDGASSVVLESTFASIGMVYDGFGWNII